MQQQGIGLLLSQDESMQTISGPDSIQGIRTCSHMRLVLARLWGHHLTPWVCTFIVALLMSFSLWQQHRQWLLLMTERPQAAHKTLEAKQQQPDRNKLDTLFGHPASEQETPPPTTALPFTLLGSFVNSHPRRSTSIIRIPGKAPVRASTGQELAPGVHLLAITTDHVLLSREGRTEHLFFPRVMELQSAGETEKRHTAFGSSQLRALSDARPDNTAERKLKVLRGEIARKP